MPSDIKLSLNDFYRSQNIGSIEQASGNALYGINHSRTPVMLPESQDTQGYVFFTRPQLNLNTFSIGKHRKFYSLLSENPASVHRHIRCLLDPRLISDGEGGFKATTVDNKLGFMPILTNSITTMSGWQDVTMDIFTSKEGVRKEQYIQADGTVELLNSNSLDCVFKNTKDEPIPLLFNTWLTYMAAVYDGTMGPYHDMRVRGEIDYMTRIYRLVMDSGGTHVTKIASTGVSFPVNDNSGKMFDFNSASNFMDQNKEITIRFASIGAHYNDPQTVRSFNAVSCSFNTELRKVVQSGYTPLKGHGYDKIPRELSQYFKNRGYPLINTNTYELGWWVDTNSDIWKSIIKEKEDDSDVNNQR